MLLCVGLLSASAQERKVENKPYIDFRPFHLGIVVGTHLQDMELVNRGPQLITDETGATSEKLISVEQDRWDAGFNVGVVGELRINTNLQLRLTPQLYFGTRHLTFLNHTDVDAAGRNIVQHQEMKTAYISTAFDVILAPLRFNNHRPYLIAGCGDMVALHETFGKVLGAFEYGTSLRRTNHGNVFCARIMLQVVVDTLHQRIFRTDYHHVDTISAYKLLDGLEVVGLHGDILTAVARSSIAWGDV